MECGRPYRKRPEEWLPINHCMKSSWVLTLLAKERKAFHVLGALKGNIDLKDIKQHADNVIFDLTEGKVANEDEVVLKRVRGLVKSHARPREPSWA